jgi:photosystem II stability/assembly factor-like uncharacterized protein
MEDGKGDRMDRGHGTATGETHDALTGFEFRMIGPHRGGRVVAVAGHPAEPMVLYFGAVGGGVWKTVDGGTYWENISDGYLTTAAVGAIAVAPSDPNVIYVGTGETTIRSDVSHGDGVYRSNDGGATWTNLGLTHTRHIAKIRIHPQNPNLAYVAALGHAWGPNEVRGLFRTVDGGATWEKILYRSNVAGAIDLSMDPHNPRILYCAFWEAQRTAYTFWSGGPGSSLYRSTDGGDTWTEITRNPGLPQGTLGKIGVALSPAKTGRVWALIEAEDGALFRSDDGGERWQRVCEDADLRRRAWYYMHVFADPQDADVVWVLNLNAWRSIDGGANFTTVPTPHGDNHDLWIDPTNPLRLIEGNDGGACVSFNGGYSWSTILNQPTAQFYHVTADTSVPYRVYGSQQDNTALSLPSQSVHGVITEQEWFVPGGGESGYIAVRPDNPSVQFAGDHRGNLTRHDRLTGQQHVIDVWPELAGMYEGARDVRHRFNWTFPIFLSPHDPNVLYVAAERLFRSTDEGSSWEAISPDLTRADPSTMGPAGGQITRDNTSAEYYATIFAAIESPHEAGTFWVGSDDGLVHLSRDGGQTWSDITPEMLKHAECEYTLISIIDLSPHDPATAYIAATRYKQDDTKPYLFKTNDYGATWTLITTGIPADDFTRVIREDPGCRGLLYAGTETGLYISFDDGEHWERAQGNLPVCPIHDLIVHGTDLIIATHGRSFWILDDVTPLHAIARERGTGNRLFAPRDTVRFTVYEGFGGGEGSQISYKMAGPLTYAYRTEEQPDDTKRTVLLDAGKNPENGVVITYELAAKPDEPIVLTILDEAGEEIREFTSKPPEPEPSDSAAEETSLDAEPEQEGGEGGTVTADAEADEETQETTPPAEPGINRFTWNFRVANATKIPDDPFSERATAGPRVPPGAYRARLKIGENTYEESFRVVRDPRVGATDDDLVATYRLGLELRDLMGRLNEAVIAIRDARSQLEGWAERLKRSNAGDTAASAKRLIDRLTGIEEEFRNTKSTSRMMYPPPNVPTRLNAKLAFLAGALGSADAAPTRQEREVFDLLKGQVEEQLTALDDLLQRDLAAFNDAVRQAAVPAVVVKR